MIGLFFGLVFSGQVNGPWLDVFYHPGDDQPGDRRQNGSNADNVR